MKVQCDYCGKEFNKRPSRIRERNFCNHTCSGQFHSTKIKVSCYYCGKEFDKQLSLVKRAKHHFCGTKCKRNWRRTPEGRKLTSRPNPKRICPICNGSKDRRSQLCRKCYYASARFRDNLTSMTAKAQLYWMGHSHSIETCQLLSRIKSEHVPHFHKGIHQSPIGGEFKYQSSYELRFAKTLDILGWRWEPNSDKFTWYKPNGVRSSYTPDFKVWLDDHVRYYETKGYFRPIAQIKVQQAQIQAPIIVLTLPLLKMFERYAKSNSQKS